MRIDIVQSVAIYLRNERVFVCPEAGPGGLLYVIEPIFETSMDESELTSALEQGLTESRRTPGQPAPSLRDYKPPILKKVGVRSWNQFARSASHCSVRRGQDGWEIQKWRRESDNSFEPQGDSIPLPAGAPVSEAARLVLDCLRTAS
jgi:hypothetical protein